MSTPIASTAKSTDASVVDTAAKLARPRAKTRIGHSSWNTLAAERRSVTRRMRDEKMRTLGRLASNIAHEISTPTQFIGDNLHFLSGAFATLRASIESLSAPLDRSDDNGRAERLAGLQSDLALLDEEVSQAIQSSIDGIARIATTVGAMRVYAHPNASFAPCDLVQILQSTLTIARAETKYVAETTTQFEHLPAISGCASELCQTFLNLLVNAAHAIADSERKRGEITVTARNDGDFVEIAVQDDGCGIPMHVRESVFERRVTTKAVGRGTGQGLALAHAIVVKRHGGSIRFETETDVGTTFFVRLPIVSAHGTDPPVRVGVRGITETQQFTTSRADVEASS